MTSVISNLISSVECCPESGVERTLEVWHIGNTLGRRVSNRSRSSNVAVEPARPRGRPLRGSRVPYRRTPPTPRTGAYGVRNGRMNAQSPRDTRTGPDEDGTGNGKRDRTPGLVFVTPLASGHSHRTVHPTLFDV